MFGVFAPISALLFVVSGIAVLFGRGGRLTSLAKIVGDPSRVQTFGLLGVGLSGLLAAIKVMALFSIGFWVCLVGGIAAGTFGVRALVRSGAKGAEAVPGSAPAGSSGGKPEAQPKSYWTDRPAKLVTLGSLFALTFIFLAPSPQYIMALGWFPMGLLYWLKGWDMSGAQRGVVYSSVLFWGWALYLGLSITIVRSTNKNLIRWLLIALVLLLIVNARGCQLLGPDYF